MDSQDFETLADIIERNGLSTTVDHVAHVARTKAAERSHRWTTLIGSRMWDIDATTLESAAIRLHN